MISFLTYLLHSLPPRVLSAKPIESFPWRLIPFLVPFFADRRNLFHFFSRDPLLHLLLSPNLHRLLFTGRLCSAVPVLSSPLFPLFSVVASFLSKVFQPRLHRLLSTIRIPTGLIGHPRRRSCLMVAISSTGLSSWIHLRVILLEMKSLTATSKPLLRLLAGKSPILKSLCVCSFRDFSVKLVRNPLPCCSICYSKPYDMIRVFIWIILKLLYLISRFEYFSEEEARMKIYSVSTRCYYAFGALVSEDLSHKIKGNPYLLGF